MPIDRDRERAKRRYAKRQATWQTRSAHRRRGQQVVGAVLAMLLVVGGVFALTQVADTSPTAPAAAGATASSTGSSTASSDASQTAQSPQSSPMASKTAKQYAKVPDKALARGTTWDATVKTNAGDLQLELYGDKAPQTVSSFIFLARDGYYDDTPCHRITLSKPLQVLQCGDPTGQGTGGPGYHFGVENVPKDGSYPAGTLAMARGSSTDSNGSQFFMTYGDSTLPTDRGGYSIFGKVTKGLDVLQAIAAKGTVNGTPDGQPKDPVTITSITVEPR